MSFHPGQLVVCIVGDDGWDFLTYAPMPTPVPKRHGVYEVSHTETFDGRVFLSLCEVSTTATYEACAFRPITESRLAIFRDLLAPVPDRKSTRLNSSHIQKSRMPSSA